VSYREILAGNGFGLEATRRAIETVHFIRTARATALPVDAHPFVRQAAQ
jgi:UDP-N-acetyl-2-amino-2-deoxyglucuronate dehydrogenase